ncbi:MAG: DEAD/DEAH box helicase, partial [Bacteroidaceae bacterium]|nr:DEAD/DEAH box helicase [Bacteroidaceae bacterium]
MNFTEQILSKLGFTLTPMQEAAIDAVNSRRNVVLLSPTGSGKTLAYLLPVCSSLNAEAQHLQAVVVVPSRELAQQCDEVFRSLKTPLRSVCLHGGRPTMNEHRTLKEVKPHIVFATPGRLLDHLNKENILGGTVKVLVVDEFDKCLELGFLEEMENVVRRLPRVQQCVLTSATDAEEIPAFIGVFEKVQGSVATRLDFLENSEELHRRQKFHIVPSPRKDKLETLARLLSVQQDGLAMVFVLHRESADRVGKYLQEKGFCAEVYHGGMEQERRERALSKFRSGCSNILVATDLAARGLDIPEVRSVVHYHPAADADAFVHRNGRTARWDAGGNIYLITSEGETLPGYAPADADVVDVEEKDII